MPGVVQVAHLVAVAVFVLLALAGLVQWRRRGGASAGWLAATLAVIALAAIGGDVVPEGPGHPASIPGRRLLAAMLVGVPYLQYRFMMTFSPSRRVEHAVVAAATGALATGLMLVPNFPHFGDVYPPLFSALVAAALVHWVVVSGLVAGRLWLDHHGEPTVARRRMRTLSVGSLCLAAAVVLIGTTGSGGRLPVTELMVDGLALASGGLLIVGFAPPGLVRLLWCRREEAELWAVKRALVEALSPADVAACCLAYASRLFGGRGALLSGSSGVPVATHGLAPEAAAALASELAGQQPEGASLRHGGTVIAVPCGPGWLAVQAGRATPFFGTGEIDRLRAVAVLAELALGRAELYEQARRSQEHLLEAQSLARVGSWEWDLASGDLSWSEQMYRIHGVEPAEFRPTADAARTLVHPEDVEELSGQFARAGQDLRPFTAEHRVVRPDGDVAIVHTRAKVVVDADSGALRMVGTVQDISERRRLEDEVAYRAFHDPLTGLANRTLFADRLGQALARRARVDSPVTVMLLDIDDFQAVNDSLGHSGGDEVLVEVGARLTALVRAVDTVARLGADEFGVLLEDTDVAGATAMAERIQAALRRPWTVDGRRVVPQASIGVMVGGGSVTAEEFLRNADVAMRSAKRDGNDGYRLYDGGMQAALAERLALRHELARAIEDGHLDVAYQPVVSLADGTVTAVEALARWRHPYRGQVGPGEFIALAEESGLIVPLGAWMLREAVAEVRSWQDRLPRHRPIGLHVNVSARQLQQDDVVAAFAAVLAETGFDPGLLTVEITESMLMAESDESVARLWELRRLGVQVAIDDFGTGYSSLSYLQRLPIDILKIDKAFVDGITRGPEEAALAHAIVKIAATLRLRTVAEGVETPAQAARLRALGCDAAQGFHFAPPLAAADAVELLTGQRPLVRLVSG